MDRPIEKQAVTKRGARRRIPLYEAFWTQCVREFIFNFEIIQNIFAPNWTFLDELDASEVKVNVFEIESGSVHVGSKFIRHSNKIIRFSSVIEKK